MDTAAKGTDRVKEDANQQLDAVKVGKVEFDGQNQLYIDQKKICTGRWSLSITIWGNIISLKAMFV